MIKKIPAIIVVIGLLRIGRIVTSLYRTYGVMLWYHGSVVQDFVVQTGTIVEETRDSLSKDKYRSKTQYYTKLLMAYRYQGRDYKEWMSLYDYRDDAIKIYFGSGLELLHKPGNQTGVLIYPCDPTVIIPSYSPVQTEYWLRFLAGFFFWAVVAVPCFVGAFGVLHALIKKKSH